MTQRKQKNTLAIAVQYDGKTAPRVSASGRDEVAELIRRLAKEHDIPCFYEPVLAEVLSSVETGEQIPENLYRAVAEVIAFAYILSDRVCAVPNSEPEQ